VTAAEEVDEAVGGDGVGAQLGGPADDIHLGRLDALENPISLGEPPRAHVSPPPADKMSIQSAG
jgi:hypothetical protein